MNITVLTLFPEQITNALGDSITGRAISGKILNLKTKNIRDNAVGNYLKVDDSIYGGGTGMLIKCDPVYKSYMDILDGYTPDRKPYTIFMSPKGKVFDQKKAIELSKKEELVIVCGHYEGIDERVIEEIVDEEISIGDFILTGGELAACVVIDSIARMLPGVLLKTDAYELESHMAGCLEHPQYTKPAVWKDRKVPDVLLSGNHKKIEEYNRTKSLYDTMTKRPDLFEKIKISNQEFENLIAYIKELKIKNIY